MANDLLQLSGLSKSFGGLKAVQNVSLAVPEGSLTALIGPNGAGKTTLFALMSGFVRPDTGTVRFACQDITDQAPHLNARLGMTRTFQIVQPFAAQTVRENIAVGAHLKGPSRRAALALASDVAARVGLAPQLDKPAADLTVAGRKRLELARALATRPRLLLLDEVLAGLNPQEIAEMIPVVRCIADGGVTVLMIEHVMQAVMNLAEHVWVLAQGQVDLQDGAGRTALTAAAYYDHPAVVLQLLRAGADMALRTADGYTALQIAKEKGHTECIAAVKTFLGEVAAERRDAAAAPTAASSSGGVESGTGEDAVPEEVVEAAEQGGEAVLAWLNGGGRVDATFANEGASGFTLLMVAALFGHEWLAAALLQRGASVDLRNSKGRTALLAAALAPAVW